MRIIAGLPSDANLTAFTRIMHRTADDDLVAEVHTPAAPAETSPRLLPSPALEQAAVAQPGAVASDACGSGTVVKQAALIGQALRRMHHQLVLTLSASLRHSCF